MYENQSPRTWYLVNCNGLYAWWLERRTGGERWEAAFGPLLPLCLSPAIRIDSGRALVDTLHVEAGLPGTNTAPMFDSPDPEGTYRIVFELRIADEPGGP